MKINFKIIILITLLILNSSLYAQTGKISGYVFNGSQDSTVISNIKVNLLVYKGKKVIDDSSYLAISDTNGKYEFPSLKLDSTLIFYPRATFSSIVYYGHGVQLTSQLSNIQSNVVVYDSTSSADQIALQLEHLFINAEPGKLFFREIFIINNAGTKTYIGKNFNQHSRHFVLEFPLPLGAEEMEILTPGAQNSVFVRDQSLYYTDFLSPGIRQFSFRFEVPYSKKEWQLSRPVLYPLGAVNIFVAKPELVIGGPGVAAMGDFVIRGTNYQRYSVAHLIPGMDLVFMVKNLAAKYTISVQWIVLIGVVILLLIGFAYTLRTSKS